MSKQTLEDESAVDVLLVIETFHVIEVRNLKTSSVLKFNDFRTALVNHITKLNDSVDSFREAWRGTAEEIARRYGKAPKRGSILIA
jgi:hypothetical protein